MNEIKDKINEEIIKVKKKREEFENNIFNLIEDTCIKLTENKK